MQERVRKYQAIVVVIWLIFMFFVVMHMSVEAITASAVLLGLSVICLNRAYNEGYQYGKDDHSGNPLALDALEPGKPYKVVSNHAISNNSYLTLERLGKIILCCTSEGKAIHLKPGQQIVWLNEGDDKPSLSIL